MGISLTITNRAGEKKTISAAAGQSLMEAIRASGFGDILALCGGCCACATCHVYVEASDLDRLKPMQQDEADLLGCAQHRTAASRLACQIRLDDSLDGLRVQVGPEE